MKISIIGSGNIGTAIAADLARNHQVNIYSSKPHLFDGNLTFVSTDSNESFTSTVALASDDYKKVLEGADIIFIALPTNIIKPTILKIQQFIHEGSIVGFVPGAGGVEFMAHPLRERGAVIFGFERVPYIARLVEYGRIVSASKKPRYRVASLPSSNASNLSATISDLFARPCDPVNSFMALCLTPTLHCSRLYDLYKDYQKGDVLYDDPLFYGEWRDSASMICFEMDRELHQVCDALEQYGIPTNEVVPYTVHYESPTVESLTKKLRSIPSLKNIKGPVTDNNGVLTLDLESRYFTESYPYRLGVVKGLSVILGVEIQFTDKVLRWYQTLSGKEYFTNDNNLGKDADDSSIPQKYGINSIIDLKRYYQ